MSDTTATTEPRRPGRPPAPTDLIRAPEALARRIKKLSQLRSLTIAEYFEQRLGPVVEEDWNALPKGVREYLEKHLDD